MEEIRNYSGRAVNYLYLRRVTVLECPVFGVYAYLVRLGRRSIPVHFEKAKMVKEEGGPE